MEFLHNDCFEVFAVQALKNHSTLKFKTEVGTLKLLDTGILQLSKKVGNGRVSNFIFCACMETPPIVNRTLYQCRCEESLAIDDRHLQTLTKVVRWAVSDYKKELYEKAIEYLHYIKNLIHVDPVPEERLRGASALIEMLSEYMLRHLHNYSPILINPALPSKTLTDISTALKNVVDFFRYCNRFDENEKIIQDVFQLRVFNPVNLMSLYIKVGKAVGRCGAGSQVDGVPYFVVFYRYAFRLYFGLPDEQKSDHNAMQHFADICLAYGKAVGLGKENMNEIQPFIAALKRLYPKIAIKGNCRLQIYECLINISEDRLKYLLSFPWQKDPHRKLSRLLNNHVPQHRARIALLRKDFETSKTILDELFDKLIKIPKQNKPTLLVEQVFPLLADWHIVQEKFTELRTYINRINKSFRNSSTTVESAYIKYVRMWEKYVHSRIGTAMIDENDELFQELENTFQREHHHWNYALLMKLWGESTLSDPKLLQSQNEYERIGSNLDAAFVKAIRISQTETLQSGEKVDPTWPNAKQILQEYPLYSTLVKKIDGIISTIKNNTATTRRIQPIHLSAPVED